MKTKLFTAALLIGSTSFTLINCGGDSGGNRYNPIVNLNPEQITFITPPEGQVTSGFCRYGAYSIEVDASACRDYAENPNVWLSLRRSGDSSSTSIPLTKGFSDQSSGKCVISGIRPGRALVPGVEHTLAFVSSPGAAPVQTKFTKFITSQPNQDASACAGSNFSAISISPGNTLSSTSIDTFGTTDAQGNWSFDWEDFATTAAAVNLASAIGSVFGFTTPNDATLIVDFNEDLDPIYLANSVALYRLNSVTGTSCLGVTGLGERISLTSTCVGQPSCLSMSANVLQVRLPNAAGGLDAGCYALILARGTRSNQGKYLDKTYYKAYVLTP